MTILLTGTSGSVGSHLLAILEKEGVTVWQTVRNGELAASLPHAVWADLDDPMSFSPHFEQVDSFFMLCRNDDTPERFEKNVQLIQLAKEKGVRKLVALMDKEDRALIEVIVQSGLDWVILRPVEFMKNLLFNWIYTIQAEGKVYTPFPEAVSAKIHEYDIAEVAAKVLLTDDYNGRELVLTGPESLSNRTLVTLINSLVDEPIELVLQSEEELLQYWVDLGYDRDYMQYFAIDIIKNPPAYTYVVDRTVPEVLGKPARTYLDWLKEHEEVLNQRHVTEGHR